MIKIDTVVIGGGLAGKEAAMKSLSLGSRTALITTGYPLDRISYSDFVAGGGLLMLGDTVVSGSIENSSVTGITAKNAGEIVATNYVLATGKFYSGGLRADMDNVYETVFGLDVCYEKDRSKWFDPDFSKPQGFLECGLETDAEGHPFKDGKAVANLVATGGILKKN